VDPPVGVRRAAFARRRVEQPLREVARAHLAINVDWNPGMDMLWGIVLATTAIGWEGRARSQSVKGRDGQAAF
jgi:hypothetical protein